mmetsp:Transcript_55295/g.83667  ORF Transcript_55295/g.83667 Transcript_55295/m.83667 type:complete len:214 (-) Transcript_55295:663-1304(-)
MRRLYFLRVVRNVVRVQSIRRVHVIEYFKGALRFAFEIVIAGEACQSAELQLQGSAFRHQSVVAGPSHVIRPSRLQIDLTGWNAGRAVEGVEQSVTQILRMVEKEFVLRPIVNGQQAAQGTNRGFEDGNGPWDIVIERGGHPLRRSGELFGHVHQVKRIQAVDERVAHATPVVGSSQRYRLELIHSKSVRLVALPGMLHGLLDVESSRSGQGI